MSTVCPACGAESHLPVDVATGWCAECHLFTGKTESEVREAMVSNPVVARVYNSVQYRLRRYGCVHVIDTDDLWPRDHRHRYRLYARTGADLRVLASSPTAGGVGVALIQLHDDAKAAGQRLADDGQIGVLDVMPDGKPSPRGEWVVLPFNREGAE